MTTNALIALGSNQSVGDIPPEDVLASAIQRLTDSGLKIGKRSRFFSTPCFPIGAGPDYVNSTISLDSDGPAKDLLTRLHQVEAAFGRQRDQRWAPRGLDLDLIAFGDQVLPDRETQRKWRSLPLEQQQTLAPGQLILPHPRLQDRAFVLVPLAEIAPDWVHPVTGLSVMEMLEALPDSEKNEVSPL